MDVSAFRTAFPEFSDTGIYRDGQINFYSGIALKLLNADRWADMLDEATQLFVAHHLALGDREARTAETGGIAGKVAGQQTSKTADKLSASYDVAAVSLENGGYWNATSYGIRLLQFARWFGAGGIQL